MNSQIEEFIRDYKGEGIEHLALTSANIYETVEKLRARGVKLQDTNETYYEMGKKRGPVHGEELERLKQNRIMIDGKVGHEGILRTMCSEKRQWRILSEITTHKGDE